MRFPLLAWILIGASAMPLVANAQIYKWIDEKGGVNYGHKPPANARNLTRLGSDDPKLSIVPGIPPQEMQAQRELSSRRRVEQFDRGPPSRVDRATVDEAGRNLESRERCFAERRVDCTAPTPATYDFGPSYVPGHP